MLKCLKIMIVLKMEFQTITGIKRTTNRDAKATTKDNTFYCSIFDMVVIMLCLILRLPGPLTRHTFPLKCF